MVRKTTPLAAAQRLAKVRVKIERAKKHLHELQDKVNELLGHPACVIKTKRDSQTGELLYYVAGVRPIPDEIPAIIGDVTNNLRSSLDHLVYQLYLVNSGDVPPKAISDAD